jgi:hypothetical protein
MYATQAAKLFLYILCNTTQFVLTLLHKACSIILVSRKRIKKKDGQEMFVLESKNQLEKAIAKAMKTRTQVKFISFGTYAVKGTKGNFYTVICERGEHGEKIVKCACKGAENGLVCYHAASALSLHVGLAKQRKEPALR